MTNAEKLLKVQHLVSKLSAAFGITMDDLDHVFGDSANEIDGLKKHVSSLRREVEILRRYGNKDCTAMADEELSRLKNERKQ